MGFNFLGALGQIGRYLPGYIDGRERAIQANWNDLNQFNQVQAGQMNNAFAADTFSDRVSGIQSQARNAWYNADNAMFNRDINARRMPYLMQAVDIQGPMIPLKQAGAEIMDFWNMLGYLSRMRDPNDVANPYLRQRPTRQSGPGMPPSLPQRPTPPVQAPLQAPSAARAADTLFAGGYGVAYDPYAPLYPYNPFA